MSNLDHIGVNFNAKPPIKLHIGCGNNILDGFINIDKYVKDEKVYEFDILNLPFKDSTVEEILAEHVLEHLSFAEEKLFFLEARRVLVAGGILKVEVPDMEWVFYEFCKQKDFFVDFYQVGSIDHYFGNGLENNNRWGVLTTHIWGNQNGNGQFHKNGYTEQKLLRIKQLLGFSACSVSKDFKKKTQVLICSLTK